MRCEKIKTSDEPRQKEQTLETIRVPAQQMSAAQLSQVNSCSKDWWIISNDLPDPNFYWVTHRELTKPGKLIDVSQTVGSEVTVSRLVLSWARLMKVWAWNYPGHQQ